MHCGCALVAVSYPLSPPASVSTQPVESLKRHGVSEEVLQEALAEVVQR
jgi:hypothetical protein